MGFLLIFAPSAGGPAPLGGLPQAGENRKDPLGGLPTRSETRKHPLGGLPAQSEII